MTSLSILSVSITDVPSPSMLFVRFYSEDGCSKSILVDESMRVSHVLDRLIAKNNVMPSVSWAVVEHLPDLFMERLVEDHELMVEPLMSWSHNTRNKLLFVQSPGKYHIFLRPEEHFSDDNCRFPEVEGQLYLKTEGKKAWKKYFFVLRASGLYYTSKGKGRLAKDLLCLQKLDVVEVYTGVSWKKKYKAPTDYGFALKHPQIQNKTPKYIKYLCAEDQDTFSQWVTGIRIAKKNLETWHSREILPNQNFAEYLAKENERNQEFAKEHHLLPRKSVCASATLADSLSENGDLDKQSLSSGTSQSSRSSTCSHDQDGSGSHASVQSCAEPVRKSSDGFIGNGFSRRGSLPTVGETQRRLSTDHNQNRECENSNEDVRLVGKMIPNLPVTTQTTRQITDQNAHSGTLKRQASYGTIKSLKRNVNGSLENRLPSPQKSLPTTPDDDVDDDDDDDFPLPPPPPELLSPPIMEETAYSIVNVNQQRPMVVYDVPKPRVGGSLPNSPQKRPPIYAKPTVVSTLSPQGHSPSFASSLISSGSAPQSPAPRVQAHSQPPSPWQLTVTTSTHTVQTPSCVVSHPISSPLHVGHRRASSSPAHGENSRRPPPPPPKRSEKTKLSSHGDSQQTQYFISDLQRVLTQKQAWSQEMGPEPSFPPTPPPHKPRPHDMPQSESGEEWLPPPPAELLLELQEVRKKKPTPPKPLPKRMTEHYMSLRKTQSYESQA
ncbi:hypothetical protein LSH36_47g03037 [Paralvinella palmiformis]|uniref:PH domain-containing protein n=1 Tax=Paralvinella palmiformis TaxID=53620 RepID=A0AAD9K691_9ANNE|nr:hypothetical protein LSH36_47g03037 [Paralvinella palmiformis]